MSLLCGAGAGTGAFSLALAPVPAKKSSSGRLQLHNTAFDRIIQLLFYDQYIFKIFIIYCRHSHLSLNCSWCGKTFQSASGLHHHIRSQHSKKGQKVEVPVLWSDVSELKDHEKVYIVLKFRRWTCYFHIALFCNIGIIFFQAHI